MWQIAARGHGKLPGFRARCKMAFMHRAAPPARPSTSVSAVSLRQLFLLRNVAVFGAFIAVVLAAGPFGFNIRLMPVIIVLTVLATLSLFSAWRLRSGARPPDDREMFVLMVVDVLGLAGIFYFNGGAENPFVWFFLLPLMIAATVLPRTYTWTMAALTVVCYSLLLFFNIPVFDTLSHHSDAGFQIHVFGMWFGFLMSAGFVGFVIAGMAHGLRLRDRTLAEARERALRNEHLVALGTLAAGAAHELGTPLGTMAILSTELQKHPAVATDPELRTKLGLLRKQVERCKDAISVISTSAGSGRAEAGEAMPVARYLSRLLEEWQELHPGARLTRTIESGPAGANILAERTLTQSLTNILNNAEDVSPGAIELQARWDDRSLELRVLDKGPGISEAISESLGKAPVSTKVGGLGVGLYLAHATIRRLGGEISMVNNADGGTITHIVIPLLAAPLTGTS